MASSSPSSYTKTTTAAATRAADTLTISGTRFSDFYTGNAGTLLFRTSLENNNAFKYQALINDTNSVNGGIGVYQSGTNNNLYFRIRDTTQGDNVSVDNASNDGNPFSIALAYSGGSGNSASWSWAKNGALEGSGSSQHVPTSDSLIIGQRNAGECINSHMPLVVYFPHHLGNSTLQLLSSLGA